MSRSGCLEVQGGNRRGSAQAADDRTVVTLRDQRPEAGLTLSIRKSGGARVVDLGGDVDLGSSPRVRRALFDLLERTSKLALNLQALRRIDSSGIATLIEAHKFARRLQKEFVLFGLSPAVRETFHVTHVNRVFRIVDTEEQAVAHV
jgi:anti-sigma B factor antagonist